MKKRKSLKDCIVKPGEKSPYANLLVDLAFKKAFDPDKPTSRSNLINLLNDLLEPQLKRPIKNVWTRNVAKNLSGSKESRTAIFDLHCKDDMGNLIEIEVQIREMDTYNFMAIELSKVPFFIEKTSSDLSKWLFFFRYLNRLKDLPEELDDSKFQQLTESSKVSNFSKREFEAYRNMYHKVWDHNALRRGFFKEFATEINAKIDERAREIAKRMIANGKLTNEEIANCSGLSIEEVVVLRSQVDLYEAIKLSPAEQRFKTERRLAAWPLEVSIQPIPPSISAIFCSTASQVGFAKREYMYSVGLSKSAAT